MSLAANYSVLQVQSTDAQIRVDVPWEFDGLSEIFIWLQDEVSGAVRYYHLGDFTVAEATDQTGRYLTVENPFGSNQVTVKTARKSSQAQDYDLAEATALSPESLIQALDDAYKLIQEQAAGYDDQSITSVNPFAIPDKVARAEKVMGFDANGNPEVVVDYTLLKETIENIDKPIAHSKEWAHNDEDVPVSTAATGDGATTFSSKHHAAKSEGFAQASASSATDSSNHATNSANSATASANSATQSETAKTGAETAQAGAETAKAGAEQAKSDVEGSLSNYVHKTNDADLLAQDLQVAIIEDQKASGTHGGSRGSGVIVRTLNTVKSDPFSLIKGLSANKFKLALGKYLLKIRSPFMRLNSGEIFLYKNNIMEEWGASSYSGNASGDQTICELNVIVDVSNENDEYDVRMANAITSSNSFALGYYGGTSGVLEVYTQVVVTRLGDA